MSEEISNPQEKQTKTPWYKDVSVLIPFFALVFTLITSLASYIESSHDDYLASRLELRETINEIVKMNEDFAEITAKYSDAPNVLAGLSAHYNTKNSILSQQATSLINSLENSFFGRGTVLDVEYMSVGQALSSSYMYDEALRLYIASASIAEESTTFAAALRSIAGIHMIKGDLDSMRQTMLEASLIYEDANFSEEIEFKKAATNATTFIQWSQAELNLGYCDIAKQKINIAEGILPKIPNSPIKDQLISQAAFLIKATSECGN